MKERPVSVITGRPSMRGKRLRSLDGMQWNQRNKEAVNARKRLLYTGEVAAKHRQRTKEYRKNNTEKVLASNRTWLTEYRAKIRAEMLSAYGGQCACCAEATPQFLQLDHIHNDGAAERKKEKCSTNPFWARLKKRGWPKDRYQLLCANCNFGKLMNGGRCPHA